MYLKYNIYETCTKSLYWDLLGLNSCLAFYNSSIVAYKNIAYKESFKVVQIDGSLFSENCLIKFQSQFKPPNQELKSATKKGLQMVLD